MDLNMICYSRYADSWYAAYDAVFYYCSVDDLVSEFWQVMLTLYLACEEVNDGSVV